MTIIQIAYEVPDAAVDRVRAMLDDAARRNPNWNGADFTIERDDSTCIPDDDSADACALLADVQRAIDDHDDLPDDPTRYTRAAVAYGAQLRKDEDRHRWICTMPNGDNCTGGTRESAAEIMCRRHGLA